MGLLRALLLERHGRGDGHPQRVLSSEAVQRAGGEACVVVTVMCALVDRAKPTLAREATLVFDSLLGGNAQNPALQGWGIPPRSDKNASFRTRVQVKKVTKRLALASRTGRHGCATDDTDDARREG